MELFDQINLAGEMHQQELREIEEKKRREIEEKIAEKEDFKIGLLVLGILFAIPLFLDSLNIFFGVGLHG